MKNNILLKMNLLVGSIIVLGFLVISALNYRHNVQLFMHDTEDVAGLTSEGIYYRLRYFFASPVNVSLAMANDHLLQQVLEGELARLDQPDYIVTIKNYLNAYQLKYGYGSVFLVSTQTGRYYNFKGLDRVLTEDNPENGWYYEFLASGRDQALKVDNDEAGDDEITVFVNCRIRGADGRTLGVVGVGLRAASVQLMLAEYERALGVKTFLIGSDGTIEVSTDRTGFEPVGHFEAVGYAHLREEILAGRSEDEARAFWVREGGDRKYVVARYLPTPSWHLIVEHNSAELDRQIRTQVLRHLLVTLLVTALILLITTQVIRDYNRRLIEMARLHEEDRQQAVRRATEKLHGNIYAINLSEDRADGSGARAYFESLGQPADTPFSRILEIIAESQVKEEFRAGYLDTFRPENVLGEFQKGRTELRYEFQSSLNNRDYHWNRIVAHIYQNSDDESVCMISYHKNIDEEKRQERRLTNKLETDEMTGLLTKAATRRHIEEMLATLLQPGSAPGPDQHPTTKVNRLQAFFIFDIDNFKQVNDTFGHAAGDAVIINFAGLIRRSFRNRDLVGRIGGDEFAVFVPAPSRQWVERKAADLVRVLDAAQEVGRDRIKFTASIGVALAPADGCDFETLYKNADQALYATKERGRNGYTVFSGRPAET